MAHWMIFPSGRAELPALCWMQSYSAPCARPVLKMRRLFSNITITKTFLIPRMRWSLVHKALRSVPASQDEVPARIRAITHR